MKPRALHIAKAIFNSFTGGRFMALFLQSEAGFSSYVIGISIAIRSAVHMILGSKAAAIADDLEARYYKSGRLLVLQASVIISAGAFLLQYIASRYLRGVSLTTAFLLLQGVYATRYATQVPIIDALTLVYLKDNGDDRSDYGKERLWGPLFRGSGCIITGILLDFYGFSALYVTTILALLIYTFVVFGYWRNEQRTLRNSKNKNGECFQNANDLLTVDEDETSYWESERDSTSSSMDGSLNSISQDSDETSDHHHSHQHRLSSYELFMTMFGNIKGAVFLLSICAFSMIQSVVKNLLFLYFKNLGLSNTLCGASELVVVLFESPMLLVASLLLKRLGSSKTVLSIALVTFAVRTFTYTYIPKEMFWLNLMLEPLTGITSGCYTVACVDFVSELSPIGYEAAGQGFNTVVVGFGSMFGVLAGGYIEDVFGDVLMYRLCTIILLSTVTLFEGVTWFSMKQNGNNDSQLLRNGDTTLLYESIA